jgi:hypothetical protein
MLKASAHMNELLMWAALVGVVALATGIPGRAITTVCPL